MPFLRLDGYYMLSHALGLADLRLERYRFYALLLRGRGAELRRYRRMDRWIYSSYGAASLPFAASLAGVVLTVWFGRLSSWFGPVAAVAVPPRLSTAEYVPRWGGNDPGGRTSVPGIDHLHG